eukprot:gnl/TRDRNA2_/TRDRNA2_194122_c0_seq1.p1 gnl/TRDRNA2_/TRDRNA2_194122_c0~~gnl/TRDRNA2_/TRDRNA2_194122_c0_seq1.p1  ORF type:complete len:203 (+),score=27.37 gnl/TRDRNA2_/TRDRNA2_194122_c0_seq1:135-743(+)
MPAVQLLLICWYSCCQKHRVAAAELQLTTSPSATATAAAQPPHWPDCQNHGVVIRGSSGAALFVDLLGLAAAMEGCWMDDCRYSDKFAAREKESCARVCISIPQCEWWVWGDEDDTSKCWLRSHDAGRENAEGWMSGHRSCSPPGSAGTPLVYGNPDCWDPSSSFGFHECCRLELGHSGNRHCWDDVYTFNRCCVPPPDVEL